MAGGLSTWLHTYIHTQAILPAASAASACKPNLLQAKKLTAQRLLLSPPAVAVPHMCSPKVFVTATARCLDLATALVVDSSVMLLTSPSTKQQLLARLDKVIFPADDVTVTDVSDKCRMLTVMGPQADDVLKQLAGVSEE